MKLVWSERKSTTMTGVLGQFLELLGGGSWSMGEYFDYFIEPSKSCDGITYAVEQTTIDSGGLRVVQRASGDNVEALERIAQGWEDE